MSKCKKSPTGDHGKGLVRFNTSLERVVWCKWCHKKMPQGWIEPKRVEVIYKRQKVK